MVCHQYRMQWQSDIGVVVSLLWEKLSRIVTKPTKWHVRSAKTQISLGIRPVWSESSLSAWRKLGSLATHQAHSKDSDQTGWMPRLIWVFAGRICHFVCFVTMRLNYTCVCFRTHSAEITCFTPIFKVIRFTDSATYLSAPNWNKRYSHDARQLEIDYSAWLSKNGVTSVNQS